MALTCVVVLGLGFDATGAAASGSSASASAPTYIVKSGDSLSGIASKSGVSLSDLLSVNGFAKSTVILPGQVIKLPVAARVSASSNASANVSTSSAGSTSSRVAKVVEFARAQVGKPYRFGSAGPDAYDCSGLVRAAYLQIGISLPHQSREQSLRGSAVDWVASDIRPGDLVFTFSSDTPNQIGHVGIAISATEWVQAPFSGGTVRVSKLPSDDRIRSVRRIVGS